MTAHALHRRFLLAIQSALPLLAMSLLVSLPLLSGCGDGNSPEQGHVEGYLWLVQDTLFAGDSALAGFTVGLVDGSDYTFAPPAVDTDESGRYRFGPVTAGTYYVTPFGDGMQTRDQSAPSVIVRADETTRHDVLMMVGFGDPEESLRVSGTVRDAVTGQPLGNVLVSHECCGANILIDYGGIWDADLTGPDGRFSLHIGSQLIGETGGLLGYWPVFFSKNGFAPATGPVLTFGAFPDTVFEFDMALQPAEAAGSIRGRVVGRDGKPVAGVPVGLDYFDFNATYEVIGVGGSKEATPVLGLAQTTGANGRFLFERLPRGFYSVTPGFLPDDGYVALPWESGYQYELDAFEQHDAGDIVAVPVVRPLEPAPRVTLTELPTHLRWEPVAGADSYEVGVTNAFFFNEGRVVDVPEYELRYFSYPDSIPAPPFERSIRWYVEAYAGDTLISQFDRIQTFQIDYPGEAVSRGSDR